MIMVYLKKTIVIGALFIQGCSPVYRHVDTPVCELRNAKPGQHVLRETSIVKREASAFESDRYNDVISEKSVTYVGPSADGNAVFTVLPSRQSNRTNSQRTYEPEYQIVALFGEPLEEGIGLMPLAISDGELAYLVRKSINPNDPIDPACAEEINTFKRSVASSDEKFTWLIQRLTRGDPRDGDDVHALSAVATPNRGYVA